MGNELYDELQRLRRRVQDLEAPDRVGVITDHGSLGGLADDDHTQYFNATRHDTTASHTTDTVVPRNTEQLWLMSMDALLTQGSNLGGSDGPGVTKSHRVNLPDGASTAWAWNFVVPVSLGAATATVTAYWTCSSGADNLRVEFNYNSRVAGDDAGAGSETAVTETVASASTNLVLHTFSTNMTLGAAGAMQRISFRRLGADGADTCTGELRLYGLLIKKA